MRLTFLGGRIVLQTGAEARRQAAPGRRPKKARAKKAREETPPLFFVVGQGKSGTGWVRDILDGHPEVLCRGEGRFFGRGRRVEALISRPAPGKSARKVPPSSLYNAVAGSDHLRMWVERSVWSAQDDADAHLDRLTGLAVEHFLRARLAESGKRIVGDKTPFVGTEDVREIARVVPSAKVVHIIRDGRDQAVSRMHHFWQASMYPGAPSPLAPEETEARDAFAADRRAFGGAGRSIFTEERLRRIVRSWRDDVAAAREQGRALLGGRYAEVRYEDLQERPEEEAARLFRFLGAGADPGVVGRCVEEASFEARSGRRRGGEDYPRERVKHRKGIAGDWKNVFTPRDGAVFKEEAGDLLVELGYEKDDDW